MSITFGSATPVFRIFDVAKALEFYVDYLGFALEWDHRFEPGLPLYMEVRRGDLRLHLSEHHGDGSPGVAIRVDATGLRDFHREISGKGYGYLKPRLEQADGELELCLIDPFGNRITLVETLGAG